MSSDSRLGLRALRPTRVADQVFEELARLIVSGQLGAGEAMPSERSLAQEFGVSRLLVRQAIHRLGELSLVTVRQGGTTIVSDPDRCDHPEVGVLALRFGPDTVAQVRGLRERQIAGGLSLLLLAERRFSKEDGPALRKIVDAYEEDPQGGHEEVFWIYLSDVTSNGFFQRETRYWFRVVRDNETLRERSHLPHPVRVAGYRALIHCLEDKSGVVESYAKMATQLLDTLDA